MTGEARIVSDIGLDIVSILHYLRTNITMTYVSQFMWRISYTFDSYVLFSTVLNIFPLWEVEGAYCLPLHKGLQRWAAGRMGLSDVAF